MATEIDDLENEIDTLNQLADTVDTVDNDKQQLDNFKRQVLGRLQTLEKKIGNETFEETEYDLIQPYERDITAETRPQLSSSGLEEKNKHLTSLSNHELHQMKRIHEKDHSKPVRTILDEPLGEILDNTINFLSKFQDSLKDKMYKAELMENIHSGDNIGLLKKIKLNIVALVLFFREDRNIIYIGFVFIFLSIIIYFTNIITTAR